MPSSFDSMPMGFAVGHKFPGKVPASEGTHFEILGDGAPLLVVVLSNPNPIEVHGFKTSKFRIGLVDGGKHTLFFLVDIPLALNGWADAPFAFNRVAPEDREIDRVSGCRSGYLITALLLDQTATILAMRAFTVTPALSDAFDEQRRKHLANEGTFSVAAHVAEVDAAYRRWPTPSHMARRAIRIEVGGQDFAAAAE